LAVVEQVNLAQPSRLSREYDRKHLSAVAKAPRQCRAFYAWPPSFDLQVEAMVVAQSQDLPTLNGYSGFNPQDWNLFETDAISYEQHLLSWAVNRHIKGLCRLNIDAGNWLVEEQRAP
jgi:hypothetical protein